MINLLFVYERKMATSEGLHDIFSSEKARKYGLNALFVSTKKVRGKHLRQSDMVIFVRNLDLLSQMILKRAKKRGLFIAQFFDDDVLNLPREAVNRVQFLPWRKSAIVNGFNNTDLVISSNVLLAKKYAEFIPSNRYVTINTVVDSSLLIPIEERKLHYRSDKVKIVFAAGANHEGVFNDYISPIIPELIKKFGTKLSFSFFGVHPDLSDYSSQVEICYFGPMSLSQYRKKIQEGYYDIGLAPLEANEFTQYKYFNKFIEYTIAGTIGIYSNVLPYTLAIDDGINGYLVDNNPSSWLEKLCEVISNEEQRHNCYAKAYEKVSLEMDADRVFEQLKHDVPEMNENHSKRFAISMLDIGIVYSLYRFVEICYLVLVYFCHTGIMGTVRKIKSYIMDAFISQKEKLGD